MKKLASFVPFISYDNQSEANRRGCPQECADVYIHSLQQILRCIRSLTSPIEATRCASLRQMQLTASTSPLGEFPHTIDCTTTPSLVSVIIPTKGRSDLLAETARSLKRQTYQRWEALLVDDASPSDERTRILSIIESDDRFHFLDAPRSGRGACAARNVGALASKGNYVVFLDSDDLLAPNCLERRVGLMDTNPHLDFAVFSTLTFNVYPGDRDKVYGGFTSEDDLDRFLRGDVPWQTAGPIWRRACLESIGPWRENLLSWQDRDFHVRAITLPLKYVRIAENDTYWRETRAGSLTSLSVTPRRIINRARLLKLLTGLLRDRGMLDATRRRLLATEFSRHAFRSHQCRHRALSIWKAGLQCGAVRAPEFLAMLFCELLVWLSQRLSLQCERLIFSRRSLRRISSAI